MNTLVSATAPAKIILFGEHFVIADKLAIAIAINLRAKVRADFNNSKYMSFFLRNNNLKIDVSINDIIHGYMDKYDIFIQPLLLILHEISKNTLLDNGIDFIIDSDIPMGAGLGSSAAVFTAFSAATLKLLNYNFKNKDIIELASKGELIAHGRPSGIDPTISTLGGILIYKRSQGFSLLNVTFNNPIVIGITANSRSTAEMVSKVLNLKAKYSQIFNLLYDVNDLIVHEAIEALKSNDFVKLGELMNIAHGLLSSLGISNLNLERLIYAARIAGAYGAKITGAGGGGAIIALCENDNVASISKAIEESGGKAIVSHVSKCGVQIYE